MKRVFFEKPNTVDDARPDSNEKQAKQAFQLDRDRDKLETTLKANPGIRLVVIDPISNYLGAKRMEVEQEVRSILIPLKDLAEKYNVAVLLVMHLNKKQDLSAISRVGGAMAFTGVARSSWVFQRNPDPEHKNEFFMLRLKNNIAAPSDGLTFSVETRTIPITDKAGKEQMVATPFVVWTGKTATTTEEALNPTRRKVGRPAKDVKPVEIWLQKYLQDGPKPAKEIVKAAQGEFSRVELRQAKANLKIKTFQSTEVAHGGWIWALPPVGLEAPAATEPDSQQSFVEVV